MEIRYLRGVGREALGKLLYKEEKGRALWCVKVFDRSSFFLSGELLFGMHAAGSVCLPPVRRSGGGDVENYNSHSHSSSPRLTTQTPASPLRWTQAQICAAKKRSGVLILVSPIISAVQQHMKGRGFRSRLGTLSYQENWRLTPPKPRKQSVCKWIPKLMGRQFNFISVWTHSLSLHPWLQQNQQPCIYCLSNAPVLGAKALAENVKLLI